MPLTKPGGGKRFAAGRQHARIIQSIPSRHLVLLINTPILLSGCLGRLWLELFG